MGRIKKTGVVVKKQALLLMVCLCMFMAIRGGTGWAQDQSPSLSITYVASNWQPFSFRDDTGQPAGLYVDLLTTLFEEYLGIQLNYAQRPWKRVQVEVRKGDSDFMVTVPTQERLEYALKSRQPILEMYLYVYTYKNHPKLDQIHTITSGEDIKRLHLIPVTNLGNNWHRINIDDHGVDTHYVPSETNAFELLASKRADITIEPLYAGSYLINKLHLADRIRPTRGRFGPIRFYLLMGRKSRYAVMMDRIDQAIDSFLRSNQYQEILDSYREIN